MPRLAVEFEMPMDIYEGLLSEEYKRFGGVIRNQGGEIVRHLVQTGEIVAKENSPLLPQFNALNLTNTALLATNLVSIGISVAGFVYISRKLNRVNEKLSEISKRLIAMDRKIDFIQEKIDVQAIAKMNTAIQIAQNAITGNADRTGQVLASRNLFIESKNTFDGFISTLERNNLSNQRYQLYVYYVGFFAMSAVGEAKCSLLLNEPHIANDRLENSLVQLGKRRDFYFEKMSPKNIINLEIPRREMPHLNMYWKGIEESYNRQSSNLEQVRLLHRTNTPYSEFETLCCRGRETHVPLLYLKEVI